MGASTSGSPALDAARREDLPQEIRDLPPFFTEILYELARYKTQLGGIRNFPDYPRISHKISAEEFRSGYTDYEYVFLTVLGFARLHTHLDEILDKLNGKIFTMNPGVQLLETTCGMTMHGDRPGVQALLRSAPPSLLEAYQISKSSKGGVVRFFREAFDRRADPCLEGRLGRILEYLEKGKAGASQSSSAMAPWEDVSVQPIPAGAKPNDIVGEHLRVFINECTWRWAQEKGINYEAAKAIRHEDAHAVGFNRLYNAATFRAAMQARGVVEEEWCGVQWEVEMDGGWSPFEAGVSATIERARQQGKTKVEVRLGPKAWRYEIDMKTFVQRNPKTGKERPIRCGKAPAPPRQARARRLKAEELDEAIRFFEDLETLPRAPSEAGSPVGLLA